jgi:thiosulfate dehydrogenase [quinone] large subunit
MDIFGWLTDSEWLAVMRIGLGLWWLESVRHKDLRDFLSGGSMGWVESLTKNHPIPAFANMVLAVSLASDRRRVVTSRLVYFGELAVGISVACGLLTPAGLLVGVFLNLNYFLLAGLRPDYGEQGQNIMMIMVSLVLLLTASGMVWGLDGVLFG